MCVATWDSVKEGFSLLWLVAPFVCFLAPMFLFFQRERPRLRVAYGLLGFAARGLGVLDSILLFPVSAPGLRD